MSFPERSRGDYTIDDWRSWEGRWELLDGIAYDMTPAPSTSHQAASVALILALGAALGEARRKGGGGECALFHAPTDVFLETGVVQPDLLVVCEPAKISSRGIEGAPDLVVEILSPGTASKDFLRKRWACEAAGIPEYLVVDPDERYGLLLRLIAGRYEEAARVAWGVVLPLLGGRITITLA